MLSVSRMTISERILAAKESATTTTPMIEKQFWCVLKKGEDILQIFLVAEVNQASAGDNVKQVGDKKRKNRRRRSTWPSLYGSM